MKKILIALVIIVIAGVAVWYFVWGAHKPKLSEKQTALEQLVGEAVLTLDDVKAGFSGKDIDFDDKKASAHYGADNKDYVSYYISDLLQPFNIDNDDDQEYPILLETKYSDGTFLDNLVILHKNGNKFVSTDQMIIGPADQVDDIHNLANNEVVIDANQLDNAGNKYPVQLSYKLEKDKIISGENNIDITKKFVPAPSPTPTPVNTPDQNQSDNTDTGTDGERSHLHFAILSDNRIDVRGYVQSESELLGWIDPVILY